MPVTNYRILFRNYINQQFEVAQYCNGNDPIVIQNTACTIPISVFLSTPFLLSIGELI